MLTVKKGDYIQWKRTESMYMYGGNIGAVALAHAIWDIATAAEKGHPSINFALLAVVAFAAFIGFPAVSLRLTGEKNYDDIIKRFDRRRNKRKELRVDNFP